MRKFILPLAAALAVSALAPSVQAQSVTYPPSMRDADQLGSSADRFGVFLADLQTRNAQRVHLARKAAKLINAGDCDKAEAMTRAQNDIAMTRRVIEVCAAPTHS
jgi:hypothetical protein